MGRSDRLGSPVEILLPASAPPITGQPRICALEGCALILFPGMPVVIFVVAFHLMGGRGCTPKEAGREMEVACGMVGSPWCVKMNQTIIAISNW